MPRPWSAATELSALSRMLEAQVSTALRLPERVDLVFCEVFDAGLLGEPAPQLTGLALVA